MALAGYSCSASLELKAAEAINARRLPPAPIRWLAGAETVSGTILDGAGDVLFRYETPVLTA